MKKIILFVFIGLNTLNSFSQKKEVSFKNNEVSKRIKKDSYTISDVINNELAIIIIERKDIYAHLFDSNFEPKTIIKTENIKSKYNNALGYSISNGVYHVLYTNEFKNKFSILALNFNTSKGRSKEIDIDFGSDIFLDAINFNNKLYLLTTDGSSKLKIREFNNNLDFSLTTSFNLEEIKNDTNLISSKISFGPFLFSGKEVPNITKIDPRVASSIEQASNENKIYQKDQYIYLTFDVNKEATQLYTINLKTLTLSYKTFSYPKSELKLFKKFNSFIYNDYLFQIASNKETMKFVIKDLENNLMKEYSIFKGQPISFKNSPIIQEGQTALPFVTKREMEETNKYLRKINSGNIGLTVIKNKNAYYLTLGGFQQIHSGGAMPANTVNGTFTGFNTTYASYNSYVTTRSTYFNSILDSDFNHVKGNLKKNIFDEIDAYKATQKYASGEDVFFHENKLFYGYFNQKESEYTLVRF